MKRTVPALTPPLAPRAGTGKREQNKLANREAILAAARTCFLETGYDAVTIRDVIRATHLASGTFYNYFTDKESLFRAVLDEKMQALTAALHEVRSHARTLEEFLYGAYLRVFTEVRNDPDFFSLMFRNEPVIRALFNDSVIGISLKALRQDLRQAQARGLFADFDAEYLTAVLVGAGYELARVLAADRKPDAESAARFAANLFLNGVNHAQPSTETLLVRRGPLKLRDAAR
jgi:AcrR family transcriptional regulator